MSWKHSSHALRLVVFLVGFVIMAVELLAGRMLAPSFGDSVMIWGSIIGSVLLAMSLGYWGGGVLADKHRASRLLSWTLAALIASIAAMKPLLLIAYSHPLIASFAVTFLPGLFAGAVMPFALKLDARSLKTLGHSYGGLSAAGSVGSVLGTFATIFLFLPLFGAQHTLVVLLALSIVAAGIISPRLFAAALLIPLLLLSNNDSLQESALEEAVDVTLESPYGPVRVYDLEGSRILSVNGGAMTRMNLSDPMQPLEHWEYVECMLERGLDAQRAYTVGLGGGALQHRLFEHGVAVVAVDINPVVVRAAQEYFVISPGPRMDLRVEDARVDLQEDDGVYDAIMLDVVEYTNYSYSIPSHLITREFFSLARERLSSQGVVVVHAPFERDDPMVTSIRHTLQQVFTGALVETCGSSQVIVASDSFEREALGPDARILTDDRVPFVVG